MPPRKRAPNKGIPPFQGDGVILDTDVVDEIESSYLEYSYSVIYSRALPDARDGLKPVHRRILYSMADAGLRPERPHVKSARVVGDAMGRFHPHGDSAIYDALVRLAQPFSMRLPLVDGHGNFGSPDDPPAAARYCIVGSTRVRTPEGGSWRIDGMVDLPENSEGPADHEVLDAHGKRVHVSKVFNSGVHAVRRVTTKRGFTIAGTDNHPLLCLVPNEVGPPHFAWRTLEELTPGVVLCIARNAGATAVPTSRQYDLGILLGAWASERIPYQVWNSGLGVKRAFLMALFEGGGGVRKAYDNGFTVQYSTYSERLAIDLQELLLEFGVVAIRRSYLRASGKREHRLIVSGQRNVRVFAQNVGFMATKQAVPEQTLEHTPPRPHRLSQDYVPYIADYIRRALPEGRGSGRDWFFRHNFDRTERWATERLRIIDRFKNDEMLRGILPVMDAGYLYDEIVSIDQEEPQVVYSLKVDTEDHSFLAGGFVNHNTEARLAPAAMALVDGLTEQTVDFEPNYDGSEQQPSVLPAAYPNLLVNGTSGIAVGMATNMIPHNLIEVVAAARHLLENPQADLDDLMRHVPGPDLPTGGQLLGMEQVRQAYETGRGVVRMRATAEVGPLPRGKSAVTVTELPYGVGAERVIAKVKELVNGKKLQGISDVKDLTDRSLGTQLVFEIKAGFNPQAVLGELYRLTPLEESFGINNLALVDGQPRTLGLKELLQVFLDHRAEVVTRRTRFRLRKAEERAHLVEGLLLALANIDEVVRIIRSSPDVTVARASLMDRFGFTDVQAGYVLDMQLRRLVALEVDRLEAELAELRASITALLEILHDPAVLRRVVSDELSEVAEEHGTARRTVLVGGDLRALVTRRASDLEVADAPCDVLLSSTGLLARTPVYQGETQAGGRRHRHDVITSTSRTTTRGYVGLVTCAGRLLRIGVLDIPEIPAVTTGAICLRGGASASEFLSLEKGDRVLALTAIRDDGPGLALATRQGIVKRVAPEAWPARSDAVDVISLRGGDEVVGAVELVDGNEEFVLFASTGDLLRFPAELVRPQGRSAGGMAGMKLDAGAFLVGFNALSLAGGSTLFEEPVVVTGGGLPPEGRGKGNGVVSSLKVTPLSEYPRKGRGTGGVRCQRLLSGEALLVLGWAGTSPWAAAANGDPVELPPAVGKRDGSGTPADKPIAAVGRPYAS